MSRGKRVAAEQELCSATESRSKEHSDVVEVRAQAMRELETQFAAQLQAKDEAIAELRAELAAVQKRSQESIHTKDVLIGQLMSEVKEAKMRRARGTEGGPGAARPEGLSSHEKNPAAAAVDASATEAPR